MFARTKKSGPREYLRIVESQREGNKVRQRVPGTPGRMDRLRESGDLDRLVAKIARFCERSMVLSTARDGAAGDGMDLSHVGPGLVFDRLWEETGCREAVATEASGRRFGFDLERVVFFSVLHRLFASGSDRQAERWGRSRVVSGLAPPPLQHLYRAMAWLGEEVGRSGEEGCRTMKDRIEERPFAGRRGLFSRLDLAFFDTTSLHFHGSGGEELGRRGHSKDGRPQLRQMVLGVVLDEAGTLVCSEMWPGNTADVTTLLPVADRLSRRFGISSVCLVADQGMVSEATMAELERRGWGMCWGYVLGVCAGGAAADGEGDPGAGAPGPGAVGGGGTTVSGPGSALGEGSDAGYGRGRGAAVRGVPERGGGAAGPGGPGRDAGGPA